MPRASDVLDFIKWGEYLLLHAEMQEDGTWPFTESDPREMVVQKPGEVEPWSFYDEVLPEYSGLLNTQLYWPQTPPVLSDRPRSFSVASSASQSSLRGAGLV